MRAIDADALKYTMLYKEDWLNGTGKEAQGVWKTDIDNAPTLDVVPTDYHDKCMKLEIEKRMALEPIVRCKDCKYFKTYPPTEDQDYTIYDCDRLVYCTDNAVGNLPDDFCSRGVRHDE